MTNTSTVHMPTVPVPEPGCTSAVYREGASACLDMAPPDSVTAWVDYDAGEYVLEYHNIEDERYIPCDD